MRIALTFLLLHFFFTQVFKDIAALEGARAYGEQPSSISVNHPRHPSW